MSVVASYPQKALQEHLRQKIQTAGPIPFAEFMETVLYHPEHGYYQQHAPKIGKEGDYYTSSDVHPIFGRLIAKQLAEMWERLERPAPFHAVEMGAGKGRLASDILDGLRAEASALLDCLQYHLIETSPYHQAQQRAALPAWAGAGIIVWSEWPAVERDGVTGCLLSNEWFDALPVHRVRQHKDGLRELYVTERDGRLVEIEGELSTPRLREYFTELGITLEEQQAAEVNLAAQGWMDRMARALRKGFVLTIDYGYTAEALYSPLRPHGTLIGYYRHTTQTDPLARLGEQDLTAHVDFSNLMRRGEAQGLKTTGFTSQKNFLLGLGLAGYLATLEQWEPDPVRQFKTRLAVKNLILPTGMGEVFKVLIQHKGVERTDLSGLAAADTWRL